MGYGASLLALFQLASGASWRFEWDLRYVGALVYLAVFGSVVAFLAYYGLAIRRGYTFASYVAALTPPTAMVISAVTESTTWGLVALAGLALVLAGQILLIRASKA
jgi:drug/metabolite transporter (DMT)-like permease